MQATFKRTWRPTLALSDREWHALLYGASGLSLAAALFHIWVMPEHLLEWWGYGTFFLVLALAQALYSVALVHRPRPWLFLVGIGGTVGIFGLYVASRTVGIPFFGPHAGHPEAIGTIDVLSKVVEAALLTALLGLVAGYQTRSAALAGRATPGTSQSESLRQVRRSPLLWGVGAVTVVGLVGAGAWANTTLPAPVAAVTASDAAECAQQRGCTVHFTATLVTPEQAEQMGLWGDVAPRLRTAQPFMISADTHTGTIRSLSLEGKVFLKVGGSVYPAAGTPLQVSTHHNAYLVFFPKYDHRGHPLFEEHADHAHQHGAAAGVAPSAPGHQHGQVAQHQEAPSLPDFDILITSVEDGLTQRNLSFHAAAAATSVGLPWAAVLGLLGGFLASMWPCLFQLTAYFIPSLAGISMQQAQDPAAIAALRWRVVRTALYFGAGIVIVYTAAGALAGYAAQSLQGAPIFATLGRPLAIGAGLFIIVMALRVAAQARVPLVCKMPVFSFRADRPMGPLATMATGVAFATGCMSCFGAVMALGMLTYSASVGSPLAGALILFVFALGISVPLVAAAAAMAQILPLLGRLERWSPILGLASSVVMVGFGVLLITDNYHVVSDLIAGIFGTGSLV